MLRSRHDIEFAWGSLVDLLVGAFAGVAILWILVDDGEPVSPPLPFGIVQVSQFGVWHFERVRFSMPSAASVKQVDFESSDEPAVFIDKLKNDFGIVGGFSSDANIAGRLSFCIDGDPASLAKRPQPVDVEIAFSKCYESAGFHPIEILIETDDGTTTDRFLHTNKSSLQSALNSASMGEKQIRRIEPGPGDLIIRLRIDQDNVSFTRPASAPPNWPPASP